ncbi:MAG: hypothetical protein Q7R31_03350 [Candidatus Levybacteria bacterium]|nr:hypothetical protein [Candidatus Levybacteria bacterium]
MDIKKIKKLVLLSYVHKKLNLIRVNKIARLLTRKDLKAYVKVLKSYEKENTVIINLPFMYTDKKIFDKMFRGKKIIYKEDPSLIAGVRIINNDIVYEHDLKNTLEDIATHIGLAYD